MKSIETLFHLHRAKSGLFSEYGQGDVAYVGNGLSNNAVVGFVKPLPDDKEFYFRGIAISAFCEATVQAPPFVACGRAGNGLVVLEPRSAMTVRQLAYIASYINLAVQWRFNWYRQTTADRLRRLLIPDTIPNDVQFDVGAAMPVKGVKQQNIWNMKLKPFVLGDIFDLEPGHYHSIGHLPPGETPIISCGDLDNGVAGWYDVGNNQTFSNRLTIAFNGDTLTTKYHPYIFAAKDDVAICVPRAPMHLATQLFIQMMMNRERWRYSYYRKCYAEKLRRFIVSLPSKGGEIDVHTIRNVVETTPYWNFIQSRVVA